MVHRLGRLAVGLLVGYAVFIGWGEAESPTPAPSPQADGPVQGYHSGYDPTDEAAPGRRQPG